MNFNSYYEPPTDRAWEGYCDSLPADEDPTEEGFQEWLEEQYDRAEDAAIERAEAAREDAMLGLDDDWDRW